MVLLTDAGKRHLTETARTLQGSQRRLFMARTAQLLGWGGPRRAERELGWNRHTIGKGLHELESGIVCLDAFSLRGRRRAEERLPHLLDDIRAIVDSHSQADPRFQTQRLYTRLRAAAVRQHLIEQKAYSASEVPAVRTINDKLHQLRCHPARVAKCRPTKRSSRRTPSSPGCTK